MISWARYPLKRSAPAFHVRTPPSGSSMKIAYSLTLATRSVKRSSLCCSSSCSPSIFPSILATVACEGHATTPRILYPERRLPPCASSFPVGSQGRRSPTAGLQRGGNAVNKPYVVDGELGIPPLGPAFPLKLRV